MAIPITSLITSSADAAARGGMYRLLARIWLREADAVLLKELQSPPLREAFADAGGILPEGDVEAALERLAIDYCRLFVGPKQHLPPYQSAWQTGQLQGVAAESMRRYVDVTGYDTGVLPRGTMLDHLGVQLDLMGHLLGQIAAYRGGAEEREQMADLARCYSSAHLAWPSELLDAASRRATTEFYRSAIMLTSAFLRSERNVD